ncbi:MAG: hypothetical protein QG622_3765 [Actinomycetota bacterium]|nr:hypothetical protein [Actinomycetota bacterium]
MRSLLLFSGFGAFNGDMLGLIRDFTRRPTHRPLVETAVEAVDRAVERFGGDATRGVVPGGIPLRRWLTTDVRPDDAVLRHSVVEGILTHLYHLCLLQPDPRTVPAAAGTGERRAVAGLGHSLGLLSAVVAGLQVRDLREYLRQAHGIVLLTALALLRCHTTAGGGERDPEILRRFARCPDTPRNPSPMASVTGLPVARLREVVDAHNASGSYRPVDVGLVNGPASAVLSGQVDALLEFWLRHGQDLAADGARWAFLRTTLPFHSRLLAPAMRGSVDDRDWAGIDLRSGSLAVPVYAIDSPRNLQHSSDLFSDCLAQVLCRPLDWPSAVEIALRESDPDEIVDHGPGCAVRIFTRDCLGSDRRPLRYTVLRPAKSH